MHAPVPRVRRPSRASVPITIGASLVVALAGCSSTDDDPAETEFEFAGVTAAGQLVPAAERAPAPAFTGELLDGTSFTSDDLAGDVAVINFWGSWCAPCRLETPDLQAVYADVRDRGVAFLGVDVKDQRQMASAFLADAGAEFDRMFLEMMTEHHQGAVDMAKTEIADGQNADAIALAREIETSQTAEIQEMQTLLTELGS